METMRIGTPEYMGPELISSRWAGDRGAESAGDSRQSLDQVYFRVAGATGGAGT